MRDILKMEILSRPENEGFARASVAAFVARLNPTLEEINDIKTAVSEAVTNSVVHGYENGEGTIFMEIVIEDKVVHIKIADEGMGIDDVERAREPLFTTKPEEERSGMGFTFMEIFMDRLEVESAKGKGTSVHMVKKIGGGK
ncbi:MAG: anti-sigma F factor [Lachnospiraceae bacterium]|nr:anti-sigma F factor [Lachnospiraceae bacterium]